MHKLKSILVVWVLVLSVTVQSPAIAAYGGMFGAEWGNLGGDFKFDNERFRGHWSESQQWTGTFCDGSYSYNIDLEGLTHSVDFEVNDENSITAKAELRDIHFGVDGNYRSSYSACLTLGGWLGVSTDYVKVRARAELGGGESLKDIKVQIQSTEFGTIHMGRWVPDWFESFVTGMVNRALVRVWRSRLGDWISAKVTEQLKKKIPNRP